LGRERVILPQVVEESRKTSGRLWQQEAHQWRRTETVLGRLGGEIAGRRDPGTSQEGPRDQEMDRSDGAAHVPTSDTNFKTSENWVTKFIRRNGLTLKRSVTCPGTWVSCQATVCSARGTSRATVSRRRAAPEMAVPRRTGGPAWDPGSHRKLPPAEDRRHPARCPCMNCSERGCHVPGRGT
jgi:hypothetical protein